MMISLRMLLCLLAATMIFHASSVMSDLAQDEAECTDKLLGLATCLTYVEGSSHAAAPTPDCCSGIKVVILKSTRCLCILIKDHDDPALGININVSRALTLPTACRASVDLTQCPKLLNLPPGSKDAQIYSQYAKDLGNSTAATAATAGAGASSSNATTASPAKVSSSKGDTSAAAGVSATREKKKWLEAAGGVWVAAPLFAVASLVLG